VRKQVTGDFVVFYAWQIDVDEKTNRRAIREALRIASTALENRFSDNNLRIILDEATRGEPGSPNIPLTILEKIKNADAFVCDITTINKEAPEKQRKVPNPNIIFELGYAVSELGWDRIVMLFNKAFGNFPKDVPFDIAPNKASQYTWELPSQNIPKDQIATRKRNLSDLLTAALGEIIKANPLRPSQIKEMTPEEIKHQRDITNLKWLFSNLHIPMLQLHINEAPLKMYDKMLHFWYYFDSIVTNNLFSLYDEKLRLPIENIHSAWGKSLSYYVSNAR